MPKPDSLHGSLDLLVLKILYRHRRLHGYAIIPARRMEEAGWIRSEWVTAEEGRGRAVTAAVSRVSRMA